MRFALALPALRHALLRGRGANMASTLALAAASRRETGAPLAGIDADSHRARRDDDARRNAFGVWHTVVGALTHQAASVSFAAGLAAASPLLPAAER